MKLTRDDHVPRGGQLPGYKSFPSWGANAPQGGKTVLRRVLKSGAKVPLFLGQTFINTLRDVGYNSTTSAVCEHVDNAIQAGATEVRVYFDQTGKRGAYRINTLVYDNGKGMRPEVLQVATSFGGSMHYDDRLGIGRYGVGMKTAALSMGPAMEIYSWEEPRAIYTMTLDVNEIGRSRSNLLELPEPQMTDLLPSEVSSILTRPMVFPRRRDQQELLADDASELSNAMGESGTIVFIPDCDRLTYKKAQTLAEHATKEMARIYRHQLGKGLRLYINNRRVTPFDPTYWMKTARHSSVSDLTETQSRLVNSWPNIQIPVEEGSKTTAPVAVRLYMLPIADWYSKPQKTLKNKLHIFEDHSVSFMRNNREVDIGAVKELSGRLHADSVWLRIQVDFTGELDEALGVAMNKQGVRPKKYALDAIRNVIKHDVTRIREKTKQFRSEQASKRSKTVSEAERRATEADPIQGKQLPSPAPETEEEKRALEDNLRTLAVTLKRDAETDEDAFERINSSTYVTTFKHDRHWPFYDIDFKLGKVILTINTAHPFFVKLYEPLSQRRADSDEDDDQTARDGELLVALQMLLFSLGRAQSRMLTDDRSEGQRSIFENLQREWSATLQTQLQTT